MEIASNSVELKNGIFKIIESGQEVKDIKKQIVILLIAEQGVIDEILVKRENEDERNKIIENYRTIQDKIIIKYMNEFLNNVTGTYNKDEKIYIDIDDFNILIDKNLMLETFSGVEIEHKGEIEEIAKNLANYAFYLAIKNKISASDLAKLYDNAFMWKLNNLENMITTKIFAKTIHSYMDINITNKEKIVQGHPKHIARIILAIKEILIEQEGKTENEILKEEDEENVYGIIYENHNKNRKLEVYGTSLKSTLKGIDKILEKIEITTDFVDLNELKNRKEEVLARRSIKGYLKEIIRSCKNP
jgi:hypothetical protein